MSVLKVTEVRDLAGIGGFSFSSGTVTALGTLKVTDININGNISGSSNYNIPSLSSGLFLTTNGTTMSWQGLSAVAGIRSMQVWTSNGTWNRPSGVETIQVSVTGAGGGGSGFQESGGAGGHAERVIDVTNTSSVSVTVGNPGGGTNYSGCGGGGNTSSFGSYCSGGGGQGANCRQQHAGGVGGNGSGGTLNVYGGGGNGHGSYWSYGNHSCGQSFYGGGQAASHVQRNYGHNHQTHAAWGSGGNGTREGNRGARGREGVVVVHEFYG